MEASRNQKAPRTMNDPCAVVDCPKQVATKGFCTAHYQAINQRAKGRIKSPFKPTVIRTHHLIRNPLPLGVVPDSNIMEINYPTCQVGYCKDRVVHDGYCRQHLPEELRWSYVMNDLKKRARGE